MLCEIETKDDQGEYHDCPNEAVYLITIGNLAAEDLTFCCVMHAKTERRRQARTTDQEVRLYRIQECKPYAIPA